MRARSLLCQSRHRARGGSSQQRSDAGAFPERPRHGEPMGAAGEGKEGQGVGFLEAGLVGPLHSSQRCFQSVRAKLPSCTSALFSSSKTLKVLRDGSTDPVPAAMPSRDQQEEGDLIPPNLYPEPEGPQLHRTRKADPNKGHPG